MPDNTALYTTVREPLDAAEIEQLAVDDAQVSEKADGTIVVAWPDVRITIHPAMPNAQMADHLNGFMGYIISMNGGDEGEEVQTLLGCISAVNTVTGCIVEPCFDPGHKAKSLIVSMACTYEECLMFADNCVYWPLGNLGFGPPGSGDYANVEQLTVRKIRVEAPETTERQQQRMERVRQLLSRRDVPDFAGPIRWMRDDDEVRLRTPQEVARRVLAMHGVVCLARRRDRDEVFEELERAGVLNEFSPEEAAFVNRDEELETERQGLIWRLEALWLLMWALGYVEKFSWPGKMCDVEGMHDMIFDAAGDDPERFIDGAKLRGKKSLLDATELITRIHWAIRQSMVEERDIPENLDWSGNAPLGPVSSCPAVGVVVERHKALNWLTCFGDDDWDDVDTPT